ncbi:MAG: mechanosensitive ion channel family protein [Candidatus Marinimicrobia bacterium]|nr:mechanosensitive ion channel family protein [Candidatus Neomarinimicrobiota bacterium]
MDEMINTLLSEELIIRYIGVGLKILLIGLVAFIIAGFINRRLNSRLRDLKLSHEEGKTLEKSLTIIPILQNLIKISVWSLAGVLILGELGINTAALIAGIGMFGIAIGFAAQSIIKDLIAGFLLILENLISVGDLINVGGIKGTVEKVGIRYTQVRLFSGELRNIPNSELSNFGNLNKGFMRVIVNVGLAYEQDFEKALQVMGEVASLWARENHDIIIEHPTVQAITEFGASELTARIIAKVKPGKQGEAEREIRRLLKQRFDLRNVDMPFARNVLYIHTEESANLEIDTNELDILPEPGSEEELNDPSLKSMVLQRETKKMVGAMGKLNNLLENLTSRDKSGETDEEKGNETEDDADKEEEE